MQSNKLQQSLPLTQTRSHLPHATANFQPLQFIQQGGVSGVEQVHSDGGVSGQVTEGQTSNQWNSSSSITPMFSNPMGFPVTTQSPVVNTHGDFDVSNVQLQQQQQFFQQQQQQQQMLMMQQQAMLGFDPMMGMMMGF